jgi:hypothetical protein
VAVVNGKARISNESSLTGSPFLGDSKLARQLAEKLRRAIRNERYLESEIRAKSENLRTSGAWKLCRKADGSTFTDWEEFVRHRDGLDAAKSPRLHLVLAEAKDNPLAKPGAPAGNTNAALPKNKGAIGTFESKPKRGTNQASYLARRLMRDAPGVFARLEAGEFPSVRQAAIAAGIVRVPTAIEKAGQAVARLTAAERLELFARYRRKTGEPL